MSVRRHLFAFEKVVSRLQIGPKDLPATVLIRDYLGIGHTEGEDMNAKEGSAVRRRRPGGAQLVLSSLTGGTFTFPRKALG